MTLLGNPSLCNSIHTSDSPAQYHELEISVVVFFMGIIFNMLNEMGEIFEDSFLLFFISKKERL
jgi:hypothetical protein